MAFSKEAKGSSGFSKVGLPGGGTRKALFGTATFGSARFGQTLDGIFYDKVEKQTTGSTKEALPTNTHSKVAKPSQGWTKEAKT